MLKEHYVFHKKSIKIVKTKQYKPWRGGDKAPIPDFVLPEAYHADHFEKIMKKAKEELKKFQKPEFKKEDVQMPTSDVKTSFAE